MIIRECVNLQGGKLCVEVEFGDFYSMGKVERIQREVLDTIAGDKELNHV